ncbi:hypothetical protein EIP91_005021 [Steccherinum ochraceum]|uniref:Copper acquisition factor BIM1-like domain-containing protein n=1 Tax=Steccherinum ochraceum TaxID=92696 RepID=A0A4R0RMN9_9APHY|nr:hypothetical protein EIP91_005021 [Steccherinum ochraceum]
MRLQSIALVGSLLGVASAHFHLQYPPPRGPFVADQEVGFCDGYVNSTTNRTEFPLDGGIISITSSHPHFTFGVIISTLENPTSFRNFTQAVDYFVTESAGGFCFPVNLSAKNLPGVQEGANVTVQMVFDGGDEKLYQCADLTLKQAATVSSDVPCVNGTTTSGSPSAAVETGAPSPTATTGDASSLSALNVAGMLGIVGSVWAVL